MRNPWFALTAVAALAAGSQISQAATVFEVTSAYHNIRVVDENGYRTLCFDATTQSRMLLRDPAQGHFEYTEYFQMPWLWNSRLTNVLMIGLGGASTQRTYERLHPDVTVESVEIDPLVGEVAERFFRLKPSPRQQVHLEDGRVYLRRNQTRYGAILVDAYLGSRYGSSIPHHLATQEFFRLAAERLSTNGVLAYNVIGTLDGWQKDLVGSFYRTMKTVFPQVYFFPASSSMNVVIIGTKSSEKTTAPLLQQRAVALLNRRAMPPGFMNRVAAFRAAPPANAARCPLLTDNFAPVEGLARMKE